MDNMQQLYNITVITVILITENNDKLIYMITYTYIYQYKFKVQYDIYSIVVHTKLQIIIYRYNFFDQ